MISGSGFALSLTMSDTMSDTMITNNDQDNPSLPNIHNDVDTKEIFKAAKSACSLTCKSDFQHHGSSACGSYRVESRNNTYPPNTEPLNEPPSPNFNINELWSFVRSTQSSPTSLTTYASISTPSTDIDSVYINMEQSWQEVEEMLNKSVECVGEPEYKSSLTPQMAETIKHHIPICIQAKGMSQLKNLFQTYPFNPLIMRSISTVSSSSDIAHDYPSAKPPSICQPLRFDQYHMTHIHDATSKDYEAISVGMHIIPSWKSRLVAQEHHYQSFIDDGLFEDGSSGTGTDSVGPIAAKFLTVLYPRKNPTDRRILRDAWRNKARLALAKQLSMPRFDISADDKKKKLDALRHFGLLFHANPSAEAEVWVMKYAPYEAKTLPSFRPPKPASSRGRQPPSKFHSKTSSTRQQSWNRENSGHQSDALELSPHLFHSQCLANLDLRNSEHLLQLATINASIHTWGHYVFLKDFSESLLSILWPPIDRELPSKLWTGKEAIEYWADGASLGSSVADEAHNTAGQDVGAASTTVPELQQDEGVASDPLATNTTTITTGTLDEVASYPGDLNPATESSPFDNDAPDVEDGRPDLGNESM